MSDPNTSSSTPIFMTRIQIQVGCYRLEILVSVAGVGGETRPLTATGNEDLHPCNFEQIDSYRGCTVPGSLPSQCAAALFEIMVAVSASSDPDRATMTTTSSSQRSQASSSLTDFPPSTAHITAKDADAQTYSELLKPIGRILSNATPQLCGRSADAASAQVRGRHYRKSKQHRATHLHPPA
ncbi:hypothetical protein V8E52_005247 [Russula decolorans]